MWCGRARRRRLPEQRVNLGQIDRAVLVEEVLIASQPEVGHSLQQSWVATQDWLAAWSSWRGQWAWRQRTFLPRNLMAARSYLHCNNVPR